MRPGCSRRRPLTVVGPPGADRHLRRRAGPSAPLRRQRSDRPPRGDRLLLLGIGDRPSGTTTTHPGAPCTTTGRLGLQGTATRPGDLRRGTGVPRAQRPRFRHLGLRQRTQQPHSLAGTPALRRLAHAFQRGAALLSRRARHTAAEASPQIAHSLIPHDRRSDQPQLQSLTFVRHTPDVPSSSRHLRGLIAAQQTGAGDTFLTSTPGSVTAPPC